MVQPELECKLKGMVVNISIYIVRMEEVKSVAKWNVFWYRIFSIYNNEMG